MYHGCFRSLFLPLSRWGMEVGASLSTIATAGAFILYGVFAEPAYASGNSDELTGVVLSMETVAAATDRPSVSGSLAGAVTLVGQPELRGVRDSRLGIEGEYLWSSDYKKSFYAPNVSIQSVNGFWTWRVSFSVDRDMMLDKTQVAFFSCEKNTVSASSCTYDYTIDYSMTMSEDGAALSTAGGSVLLAGAESASAARYDLSTGSILEGSGGVALSDWTQPLLLQAGHTYTYSMTASGTDHSGTFSIGAGFGAVRFIPAETSNRNVAVVPEPASSVLSLTVLAALLLRRRRMD